MTAKTVSHFLKKQYVFSFLNLKEGNNVNAATDTVRRYEWDLQTYFTDLEQYLETSVSYKMYIIDHGVPNTW